MHDLRKKVLLESQKTVSRKARLRPESARSSTNHSPDTSPGNSRAGSRANSRPSSRPGSRYASEDEDASDSDIDPGFGSLTLSTGSASGDDAFDDDLTHPWAERLQDRIGELQDRKRSGEGREATLTAYLHLLRHHYAGQQVGNSISNIIPALLKSIGRADGVNERLLALRALMATLLTSPSQSLFGMLSSPLRSACEDANDEAVKVQAIYALMIAVTYGGGDAEAADGVLDFLIEIIESDGETVGANDSGAVVTAALRAWAFVATFTDDIAERNEHVMDTFIEQLDSTDAQVQISAGTNIAFLSEAARDDEEDEDEDETDRSSARTATQYNTHRTMTRMSEIIKNSAKSTSRKERRELRSNFRSIVTSLERGVGPNYSEAGRWGGNGAQVDAMGDMEEIGHRGTLRVGSASVLIDTWSLQVRVDTLKMVFQGGLGTHYQENPVVRNMLETAHVEYHGPRRK